MSLDSNGLIYLDNASTSYPKPESVTRAVATCMLEKGANPGRGSHRMAVDAAMLIAETRELLASLINAGRPIDIAFTCNCTEATNTALKGLLRPGDHVITTSIEHNAVTRPLKVLERSGVMVDKVYVDMRGNINVGDFEALIAPNTRLITVIGASNVNGAILPLKEIGSIAKKHGVLFMVDAAQLIGHYGIDVRDIEIDVLAFSGHKALLGPQGTGALYIRPGVELIEMIQGGTGSTSESLDQPRIRPDRYESGTPNTPGIAGLGAAVKFLQETTIERISEEERGLVRMLIDGLSSIDGVTLYGPPAGVERVPVVPFNIDGVASSEVSYVLDRQFGIASRSGLQCAGDAHRSFGTLESGMVRLSPSFFNSPEDIEKTLEAVSAIAKEYAG
ncbi:MAG TPA: aminotransferase class V-fold PLP-dependent enzyme [Anaerolineae bacterium]|jgi:cysteine desulfurase family protein|nr:aminotransferase class V-fold PLP-dependent enzyme [Anaerolineae bacterium]